MAAQPPIAQFSAAPPAPVAVPNPAATTPVVSPDQSMVPADNPDYGGPSRAAPMPNAPPREGVDVPATVMTAPAPAPGPAAPVARAPVGAPRNDFAPIMLELAKQPGTGHSMMQLFGADVASQRNAATERAKIHQEGIKLFADASKNSDIATMRAISQKYDLGIPPEVLNRREVLAKIAVGINTAKSLGLTDDDKALAFAKGYTHAEASGSDPYGALEAGYAESKKIQPAQKAVHWAPAENGEITGFTAAGTPIKTGVKARPLNYELESNTPGKQSVFQQKQAAWLGVHPGDNQGALEYASGRRTISDVEVQKWAIQAANKDRQGFRNQNWTPDQFNARVQQYVQQFKGGGGGGAGAPAPAAGTEGPATAGPASVAPVPQAAAAAPAPRRMRFDAAGNEIPQ